MANAVWTAAQFNAHVRDNLNETMPGKATTAGRWFVSQGANSIAEREIASATVNTSQTTTSLAYTDLATVGPSVTLTTGTRALVFLNSGTSNTSANVQNSFSYAVSGATTIAASDTWRGLVDGVAAGAAPKFGTVHFVTNLTPGANTFTMKYKTGFGTATFYGRNIIVMAM
ncbi:hypothetical protein ACMA1D_10650 [Streptomyces sp. 796.1]|uniref:hypothetical protein n=1 Tax=Streptomyces sp. 796.1 TaxID=3163029 RepID=UPI0039C92A59